ncbi:GumC family protein [Halopseudomonas xiamenensis]|uniref:GumC family protein n=1 Tax=Halopseudomonas xiamenensis TaxID=157792 RepID=UPI0016297B93|nr:Wzz/FepE/Etk N-terminal domain-containing protein [Halopseudomonas xiamenensis]
MNRMENYLHEFLRVLFANRRLIKRIFLAFAIVTLLLPLLLKQSFDITADVIVQSKKLSQADSTTTLMLESDKFLPPSLADMETESNILRSPALIREAIAQLLEEDMYSPRSGIFASLVTQPAKRFIADPLRTYAVNPLRSLIGLDQDPVRDTTLDRYTARAVKDLNIEILPGSNVISIIYSYPDPVEGTRLVERLLANYLVNRQSLQSNDLPEAFYEQKKAQYEHRLDDLEGQRLALLESIQSSDPKEEITFRLNAINTEEQSLNLYRDRALESERWLSYLEQHLEQARRSQTLDYAFPFTFAHTVDNVAYEDREIKQLGEQLFEQVTRFGNTAETFQQDSLPIRQQRDQIKRTQQQFLGVVSNRIQERSSDLDIARSIIVQKEERIAGFTDRIRQLQEAQSKLRQLETEIDALHKAFFTYTQRYEESRSQLQMDGELSNARILSAPYEPAEAAFPKPKVIIPLGLLTGLLLAVAIGYVREFFDHRFKHPEQITQHLGLPVLMVFNTDQEIQSNPHRRGSWRWLWHWVRQ